MKLFVCVLLCGGVLATGESFVKKDMVYGHMRVLGSAFPMEYFRATFGGPIQCGARRLVLAPREVLPTPTPSPSPGEDDIVEGDLTLEVDDGAVVTVSTDELEASPTPAPGADRVLCSPLVGADAEAVSGAYVAAWRGACPFSTKAFHALAAGAAGVVLVNTGNGLLRAPTGPVDASNVTFPIVMVRNLTAPLLLQAWQVANEQGSPLTASLDPAKELCMPGSHQDEAATADARVVAPDGRTLTKSVPFENNIADEGLPKSMALTEAGFLTVQGTDDAAEFVVAYFSGIIIPNMTAPLSFPEPFTACDPVAGSLAGTIAVVDRGVCPLVDKARHLQAAGAVAAVFVNLGGTPPPAGAPEAAPEEGFYGDFVGAAQAFGDEAEPMVAIPAVMVSREAAGDWRARREELEGVAAVLSVGAARASAWEDLKAARDAGPGFWKPDVQSRMRQMEALLRVHHPESRTGSAERLAFVEALAAVSGLGHELEEVAKGVALGGGSFAVDTPEDDEFDGSLEAVALPELPPLLYPNPVSAYVSQQGPVRVLDLDMDSATCGFQHGKFSLPLAGFDSKSVFGLDKKIKQLLKMQACLERVMFHHAASLGQAVELYQSRLGRLQWGKLATRLAEPYGIKAGDAEALLEAFVHHAHTYTEAVENGDPYTSIQEAFA